MRVLRFGFGRARGLLLESRFGVCTLKASPSHVGLGSTSGLRLRALVI